VSKGKSALGIVRKYYPNVTSITDAKKPIQIEVTASDCKAGRRKGASSCAMAHAFQREYDGAIISLSTAYLIKGDKAVRYRVPHSVSREIVSFDRARKFAPGDYHLDKPAQSLGTPNSNSKKRYKNSDGQRYAKHKARSHKTAGIRSL
jgi:hypothetical protein